jgi:uncharacterized damage-inducible protein DinB
MQIAQAFLAEFEHEAAMTRPFLERVPQDKLTWRPHAKSMTAGQLALHIAGVPGLVTSLAKEDAVPAPDFGAPPQPQTVREILEAFDASVAKTKQLLPTMDDAAMGRMWSAMVGDKPVLSMPRAAFLRNILLNHWYQHRGQMGVYLRMLDVAVPSTYGPSADESPAFMKAQA